MEVLINTGKARPDPGSRQRLPKETDSSRSQSEYDYYRRLLHLKNDQRIILRFLQERDRHDLIDLFQQAAGEDVWFFKHDLRNRSLLNYWLNHLDYGRLLPLVAVDPEGQRLMAAATLLRGKHTAQHIGEIKLFIAKPFRNLGLGSLLLDELIRLGRQEKLHWLKAEVVADQEQLVKALQRRGFQIRATLEDFFMGQNGETYDVLLMMLLTREDKPD